MNALMGSYGTPARGDSRIRVAVIDGVVDEHHPCFAGASLSRLPTLVGEDAQKNSLMANHGTHVASILFGQPGTAVEGIIPDCHGLLIPVFPNHKTSASQLDLARAIEQAVEANAHVINISGGELTDDGESDTWLRKAVNLCRERNVLIVAAAGNNGCACLHVPAAMPSVLAVGAMNADGLPLDFSNWGAAYRRNGLLAPGSDILGAVLGGSTLRLSGTSFATPIVSGVAALLLSEQLRRGEKPDPHAVRRILLDSALPCGGSRESHPNQCLAGKLNVAGAFNLLKEGDMAKFTDSKDHQFNASCACGGAGIVPAGSGAGSPAPTGWPPQSPGTSPYQGFANQPPAGMGNFQAPPSTGYNQPPTGTGIPTNTGTSTGNGNAGRLVYALGTLGYDFGTEARRDSFKQLMKPPAGSKGPVNPYDPHQMIAHLKDNRSEARSLIWTLNIELTPVYAIEPAGSFGRDVYDLLFALLSGQIQPDNSDEFVERVSMPGVLTGRTVKLFSGQVVPVIEPQSPRGIEGWRVNTLAHAALAELNSMHEGSCDGSAPENGSSGETPERERQLKTEAAIKDTLAAFLNRIYYDLRNLGTTPSDRALNFAVTRAFQAVSSYASAAAAGLQLDSIAVEKTPFGRPDSDCWDVKMKFFDPENNRRAKRVYRFTVDVSDIIPVILGDVRSWSSAD